MSLIVNLSERVIMNISVCISLNESSSMISFMNTSVCMNLQGSPRRSKSNNMYMSMNKNVSMSCACVSE